MALRVTRQYGEVAADGAGELRVTRQYGEVLAAGDGKIRVTRQYIEVLVLSFADYQENTADTISFTQNVSTAGTDRVESLSDIMSLSHNAVAAVAQTLTENIADTLNFTSVASRAIPESASNTMSLTQAIVKNLILQDFFPMSSTISFTQQVDVGGHNYWLSQDLGLTDQLDWVGPKYHYITTYLSILSQEATASKGVPWLPIEIEHTLDLAEVINLAYPYSLNNVMTLTHEAYRSHTPTDALGLVQAVENGKGHTIPPEDMGIDHTVLINATFLRSVDSDTTIGHALTYYIDSACGRKQYAPFIGENTISNAPSPPSNDLPLIQNDPTTTRFKLSYPALAAPTVTVELRAPELDNIDRIAFNRISRETRGGQLTIFADPTWPQVQTVIVTFVGLLKTEVDDLHDFFVSYVGEEIGMSDWEGREWIGVVTTPNEAAVHDGKGNWTITFEFEGVLVDSLIPSTAMSITDSIGMDVDYTRSFTDEIELIQSVAYIKA
jgi:hypothetical protein